MKNQEWPLTLLPDPDFPCYTDLATLGMLFVQYAHINTIEEYIIRGIEEVLIVVDKNGKADHIDG